ncbi:MAG: CarD family transcriptional regulator [Rickettsiales bacterium]|jgi:CarD family transcriptional regulator|nr:CarD family transcriptional regulator [Rickettsiales bacterium]
MAKLDFKVNDYVVYPTHGVGQIIEIGKQTFADQELELITIRFEKNRMILRVPTEKAEISGLRKITSKKKMDDIVDLIKDSPQTKRIMWARRAQIYDEKINSGDPVEVAEVVRDLYRNYNKMEQSFSERQIYQKALERLANEYAVINKTNPEKASEKLEDIMQKSQKRYNKELEEQENINKNLDKVISEMEIDEDEEE